VRIISTWQTPNNKLIKSAYATQRQKQRKHHRALTFSNKVITLFKIILNKNNRMHCRSGLFNGHLYILAT